MRSRLFTDHPASVGESYGEHLRMASYFGSRMILAGLACLVHGLLPFLFTTFGSRTIAHLSDVMIAHRGRKAAGSPVIPGAFGQGREAANQARTSSLPPSATPTN